MSAFGDKADIKVRPPRNHSAQTGESKLALGCAWMRLIRNARCFDWIKRLVHACCAEDEIVAIFRSYNLQCDWQTRTGEPTRDGSRGLLGQIEWECKRRPMHPLRRSGRRDLANFKCGARTHRCE